jgi:two-component system sensor histidine kinase/response regulator
MMGIRQCQSKSQNTEQTTKANGGPKVGKAHILVVDNDFGPRESLRVILSPYYHVHLAESGAQALNVLRYAPIDLITLDLTMPGMSGIEVLTRVKKYDPSIEVLIVTASASLDAALEGLRLGAFDYVIKPFDVHRILSLVKHGLKTRRNTTVSVTPVDPAFSPTPG